MRIRYQGTDPVIQEAAKQGVRVYRIGHGHYVHSAKEMARHIGASESVVRRAAFIEQHGLGDQVRREEMTSHEAFKLAGIIHATCPENTPKLA